MNEVTAQTAKILTVSDSRRVAPIIPQSTDDITRIAVFMGRAGAIPKSYGSGEEAERKASIAIMKGLEMGWLPMQSVQNMCVINGIPALYGDGAIGRVRETGHLEYCKEWLSDAEDTAFCEVKRKGEPESVVRTFSKQDALTAGLLNKPGPWKLYPKRMMQMRARAFALRDVFADALIGLRIFEELQDYELDAEPKELKADPFADTAQITHEAAPDSPTDAQDDAIDVEAEDTDTGDVETPEDDGETQETETTDDETELLPDAAFQSVQEAMDDIAKHIRDAKTDSTDDLLERYDGWKALVIGSFKEPKEVDMAGRKLVNQKRLEIEKANA